GDDVRSIAHLYVFAAYGYYQYHDNVDLPQEVEKRIFPYTEKPKGMSQTDWLSRVREKGFVKGVLDAPDGHLEARNIICYPHFASWADELPIGHRFKPQKKAETLNDKYRSGTTEPKVGQKLKVREQMREVLSYVDAVASVPCRIYYTLSPLSVACEAAAVGLGNDGGRCPAGTLYDIRGFEKHTHPNDTAHASALQLLGASDEKKKLFSLVKDASYRGRNY
ncbi:hypothetical protein AAVH_34832, partial [Aphelenchoides avenae]